MRGVMCVEKKNGISPTTQRSKGEKRIKKSRFKLTMTYLHAYIRKPNDKFKRLKHKKLVTTIIVPAQNNAHRRVLCCFMPRDYRIARSEITKRK